MEGENIFLNFSISDIQAAFKKGELTSLALVKKIANTVNEDKKSALPLNDFLELYDDIFSKAEAADAEIEKARKDGTLDSLFSKKPLLGIPFANKDNISVKGKKLTCASKILEGYVAPYDATVIARLEKAGAIPLGRCNQDEFAMGSSTEYSIYGPTRNPVNREYVSGGSSGGSTAAVASNNAVFALGTETGGSVRLPASYCGVYGLKPTYGTLSRWGVVAYGSSLDQVGLIAHTPSDIALPLFAMCGQDMYDDTSSDLPKSESLLNLKAYENFKNLRIALPRQFIENKGMSADVATVFQNVQDWFKKKGASIKVVDIPVLDAAVASYYVLALAEAASNLSRFDGIRYGHRIDQGQGYDELFIQTRSAGFGAEVKRRIVVGNYVLSEQYSGDTYKKGMTVRSRIQKEIAKVFESFDLMICPVCPTPAFKLGQNVDDPLEMYLSDLFTGFVNLARNTAISVPAGSSKDGLPIGIQFVGAMFSEPFLLQVAQSWEEEHSGCGFPLHIC
ncbi:MAG: Asp-tRNA(Asn)/Glu-tRNA(Gln) amidotransferase subunit GatA [Treponema sp.]|nr:Asp-tRNA(Asn)/Glu-tRNA(Gln) amidotransferase subunit GatA [Treponema sp.]